MTRHRNGPAGQAPREPHRDGDDSCGAEATNDRTGPDVVAVVLLQLGGPSSLDDVQPFLESMFLDPDLIRMPGPPRVRRWLAGRLAAWRAKSSGPLYAAIGGKSPIIETTQRQAELLERALRPSLPCRVFVAMRYGSPSTATAVARVLESGCSRVLRFRCTLSSQRQRRGVRPASGNRRAARRAWRFPQTGSIPISPIPGTSGPSRSGSARHSLSSKGANRRTSSSAPTDCPRSTSATATRTRSRSKRA